MISFHRPMRKRSSSLYYLIFLIIALSLARIAYRSWFPTRVTKVSCSQLCPYSSTITRKSLRFNNTRGIRHFPSFVCPQNFRNLADWVFGWPDQFNEKILIGTQQGQLIAPCLPPGSIIYVRIWAIDQFFKEVYPYLQNNFVLITGEGDLSSPNKLEYLNDPDSKIIHWFGQNGQIDVSVSKKFTHIPIGINCYEMADAIGTIYGRHSGHTLPSVFNDSDEPNTYVQPIDITRHAYKRTVPKKNLVMINFDPDTDESGLRNKIWKDLCDLHRSNDASFTECKAKKKGVQITDLSKIYQRNRQYPFWLSPRGNGIDCHRTWEALYLDVIPIVWNSSLNVLYENLPVVIINDHKELNPIFLYEKLSEITRSKLSSKRIYAYEKLRNAYWRRMILEKSRHASKLKKPTYQRTNQCWSADNRKERSMLEVFS